MRMCNTFVLESHLLLCGLCRCVLCYLVVVCGWRLHIDFGPSGVAIWWCAASVSSSLRGDVDLYGRREENVVGRGVVGVEERRCRSGGEEV